MTSVTLRYNIGINKRCAMDDEVKALMRTSTRKTGKIKNLDSPKVDVQHEKYYANYGCKLVSSSAKKLKDPSTSLKL